MKPSRLWPVLAVLALLLAGSGLLEWAAAHHGAHYQVIRVEAAGDPGGGEDGAEPTWQATPAAGPEHARARLLLRRGELDQALALYAGLVGPAQSSPALLAEYAYVLRRADRCADALPVLERARQLAPEDAGVNLASALNHRCLGEDDAAAAAFERALQARPTYAPTRLAYGAFLRRRGDLPRAVEVLEPAARAGSNEERAQALAQLGRCLLALGEDQRAHDALEEAIQRAPADVSIWLSVARTYLRSDHRADALRALHTATRATQLAPDLAPAYVAMGRAYEDLDLPREAFDAYRRAVELDGRDDFVLQRLVRLGIDQEAYDVARASAERLLEIAPDESQYRFLLGLAAARLGDVDAARQAYAQAIEARGGAFAEAWFNLGLLEREAGRPEAAADAYRQALAARPNYAAAWNNLGLVYDDLARWADAESAFQSAIALRQDYAAAWANLAQTFARQDRYEEAATACERALALDPDNRTVRLRLAVAYRRTGRLEGAIQLYRDLVADEPRYVAAWYNLGIALAAAGRDDEAIEAYATALDIDPDHQAALENLGLAEARLGRGGEALGHLTEALDMDPTDTRVRLALAELSLDAHDLDRCAREARLVLTQVPESQQAHALLGRCAQRSNFGGP